MCKTNTISSINQIKTNGLGVRVMIRRSDNLVREFYITTFGTDPIIESVKFLQNLEEFRSCDCTVDTLCISCGLHNN